MHNALGLVFRNGAIHGRRDLVSDITFALGRGTRRLFIGVIGRDGVNCEQARRSRQGHNWEDSILIWP